MKYFSTSSSCPKCGNHYIGTKFTEDYGRGLIRRTCKGCGYWWHEKPLDYESTGKKESE